MGVLQQKVIQNRSFSQLVIFQVGVNDLLQKPSEDITGILSGILQIKSGYKTTSHHSGTFGNLFIYHTTDVVSWICAPSRR